MKLSTRIALLVAAFTIVFATTLAATLSYFSEQRIEREGREWATLMTQALSDSIARSVAEGDVVQIRDTLLGIVNKSDEVSYMFIEGIDGDILVHSFESGFPEDLLKPSGESDQVEEHLFELSDGSRVLDLSEPIIAGMSARLHIGINRQISARAAQDVAIQVGLLLLLFSALGAIAGIIAGRKIAAPIEDVARKMFAFGRYGVAAPFEKMPVGDEESMLVSAFETMVESRKEADQALRMREAALNDAQRIAHLGSWDWNIDTGELWWSDEIYRVFGIDPAEFGASYEAFVATIHPDDRDKVTAAVDYSVANNTPYAVKHRIVLPDDTERIVQEQGEIYISEATGKRHMSGIVHDITELENAFADLRQNRGVLAEAQRLAKIGHWESEADRRVAYWSGQMYEILGLNPDEAPLPRELFAEYIHPDDKARFLELVERPAESDWPANSEFRLLVKGDVKYIRINRKVLYADDGSIERIIGTVQDVTELDAVAKKLEYKEALLVDAQRIAKFGHWEVDPELQNVYWSDQLYELFGLGVRSVTPSTELMHKFLHPDDLEWFKAMEAHIPSDGMPPVTEFRIIVDGKTKHLRMHTRVEMSEQGAIRRIIGTSQEITASKELEIALRENEERLERAQEIAHVGNFEWQPAKDELWWSDEAYRIFGFEPQVTEINYPVFMESAHPDDRAYLADKIARMLEGEPYDIEHRIVRADGSVRTVNEQGIVEWDDDGNPAIVRGIMFDITERRAAFAASERLGRIIEDSTSEIFVFDMETLKFNGANRSARENLGYEMSELKDMSPVDVMFKYSDEEFLKIVQPLVSGRERAIKFDTVHKRKDGSLYNAAVRLQLTRKGEAPAFFASIIDITERLKAAESERLLRQQLTHAARLGAIGGMATGLAHEINQPLSAISNYAQVCIRLLENGKGTTEEIIDDMRKISQQVERAAEIIKWLRKTVRREAVDKTSLDINACISEVVDLMEAEFRARKSRVQLELSNSLPPVTVNRVQIQQVLVNLIQNSLNAADPRRPHTIVIKSGRSNGEMIEIDVEDDGPGVPPDIQDEIFTPFFSTKGEGLGFGLSVSRSIIEAHGGELWLDPEFTPGAAFRFVVPVHDEGVV